ncbi:MAG: GNA1162 family protein [Elusimicrobiota bacterium]
MKKNFLFLLLAGVVFVGCRGTGVVFNQHSADLNKITRIAVIPVDDALPIGGTAYDRHNVVVSDLVEMAFISLGYTVVDTANLSSILKEQALSVNGLIDPADALKIGKQYGVDTLAFVNTSGDMRTTKVRLVDTEKGRVIFAYQQPPGVVDHFWAWKMHKDLKKALTAAGVQIDASKAKTYHGGDARGNSYSCVNNPALIKSVQKVAISPDSKSDLGLSALLEAGFDVMERSELGKILRQNNLAASGVLSGEDMKKLGSISGVKGIVFSRMTDYKWVGSKIGVTIPILGSVKLVDAQTGQVLWVACPGNDANYFSAGNLTREDYIASSDKTLAKYLAKMMR